MSSAKKSSLGTGVPQWLSRLSAFSVESLFSSKAEPGPARTVFVHQKLPQGYYDIKGRVLPELTYNPNQVVTSKYTIITFIPRNLLEQFRRVANIYFLGLSILQFFPLFTTVAPGVVILPLLFIVSVTALKDGYEDYQRHIADQKVNYSKTRVLSTLPNPNPMKQKSKTFAKRLVPTLRRGSKPGALHNSSDWQETLWEDLNVGDFVMIMDDEAIPADILICSTSEEDNVAFVETKNLDGETNLKSRRAVDILNRFNSAEACMDPQHPFSVKCERPDTDMYRLNAVVGIEGKEASVDASMVLLRGTILRNTSWAG